MNNVNIYLLDCQLYLNCSRQDIYKIIKKLLRCWDEVDSRRWASLDRMSSDSNLMRIDESHITGQSRLYVLILKPLLLAMRPSAAVVG